VAACALVFFVMNIIGAGIIGLSCAWRLAQRGIPVRLFDAKQAASDASWAAAGMFAPGSEMDGPREVAELAVRSARAWPAFVEELQQATGLPIDYRACEAHEFTTAEIIARRTAHLEGLGVRVEPRDGYWYYPDDAIVDPRQVNQALLAACRRLGVELHENEPVLELRPDGSARTAAGEYPAVPSLIAAAARSSELFPGLPRTFPIRGQLLSWRLEPGALPVILREGHTYIFQRSSGLVVAGSTTEHVGWDARPNFDAIADLRARAAELFPRLAGPPLEAWIGFRPGIEGHGPCIGQVPGTAVWTAFGHYRNGILMAPETARIIAGQMSS
jgi:glycine oxidase